MQNAPITILIIIIGLLGLYLIYKLHPAFNKPMGKAVVINMPKAKYDDDYVEIAFSAEKHNTDHDYSRIKCAIQRFQSTYINPVNKVVVQDDVTELISILEKRRESRLRIQLQLLTGFHL